MPMWAPEMAIRWKRPVLCSDRVSSSPIRPRSPSSRASSTAPSGRMPPGSAGSAKPTPMTSRKRPPQRGDQPPRREPRGGGRALDEQGALDGGQKVEPLGPQIALRERGAEVGELARRQHRRREAQAVADAIGAEAARELASAAPRRGPVPGRSRRARPIPPARPAAGADRGRVRARASGRGLRSDPRPRRPEDSARDGRRSGRPPPLRSAAPRAAQAASAQTAARPSRRRPVFPPGQPPGRRSRASGKRRPGRGRNRRSRRPPERRRPTARRVRTWSRPDAGQR